MSEEDQKRWQAIKIREIGEIITGTTPSTKIEKLWDGGIPFVTPADFSKNRYIESTEKSLSYEGASFTRLIPKDTILVSCIGTIGAMSITSKTCATNQQINALICKKHNNPIFIYYSIFNNVDRLKISAGMTTIPIINKTQFGKLEIPVPSLIEQNKISKILTTVDNLIEKTEALIAKYEAIKQGMMHDLFARGVDENGRLRSSYHEAPELYKKTEFGWIPKDWCIVRIGDVEELITSGSRGWASYYSEVGALFIRIGNLTRENINFRWEHFQRVMPPKNSEGERTAIKEGDVLISITADLGIIAVVPHGLGEAYVNQHISLVRLRTDAFNLRWAGRFLAGERGQNQFERHNDMGTKAGLNLPTIRSIKLLQPQKREQNTVTSILDKFEKKIEIERTQRRKYRQIKTALMQDLLTGKVRVPPDEETEAHV